MIGSSDGPAPAAGVEDKIEAAYRVRIAESLVDDSTWLAMGKRLLEETIPTLNTQAKQLATTVGWFWTVYSSATVAASIAVGGPAEWADALLVAPILTLLLAYLFVMRAQSPVRVDVDVRSVDDIRDAVQRTIRTKVRSLRWVHGTLVLSALLIGGGLVLRFV